MTRTVEDIMTRAVVTLREEDNMLAIAEGMHAYGLRHIPVVDNGKLVGLLTHRDVLRFKDSEYTRGRARDAIEDRRSEQTFVASVMTRDVQTVRPETPLAEAAQQLVNHKFGCLPVTSPDGTLQGIVTEHDFLKAFVDHLKAG